MKGKNVHAVELGRLGGKAGHGAAKARGYSAAHMTNLVRARWRKASQAKAQDGENVGKRKKA